MQRLSERQYDFAAAILDPERSVPAGLVGPDGEPSERRFSVYRNNVVAGLIETLKAAFPAVHRIVGEDFFSAMARIYVSREPPSSPIMLDYGGGFPDFMGAFEPAAGLIYLRDVGRLERAWAEAYHAREARPLDPTVFATIVPDDLATMRLMLHPSVRVVGSLFPTLSIWQMNIEGAVASAIDLAAGGQDTLIVRSAADVEVRLLPAGGAVFIQALADNLTIVASIETALRDAPDFDFPASLSGLLEANAVVGYKLMQDSCASEDVQGGPDHG